MAVDHVVEDCPAPSPVHGDLWSGNAACLADAMLASLTASYHGDCEYERRKSLYNLYHMLNHLNLFGSGYRASCLTLTNRVLA